VAKGFISGLVWGVLVSGVAGAGASVYNSGSYKGLVARGVVANKPEAVEQGAGVKVDEIQPDVAPSTEPVKVEEPAKAEEQSSESAPDTAPEPAQPEAASPDTEPKQAAADSSTETKDEAQDKTDAAQSQEAQQTADAAKPEEADVTQNAEMADKEEDQLAMQTDTQNQTPPVTPPVTPSVTPPTPEPQKDAETSKTEQDQAAEKPAGSLMAPVLGIANMAPNVETGRLPSIGGDTETATENQPANQPAKSQGALLDFAADFDNPNQLPVMSIVLIDDPKAPVPDNVLKNLPFSISFAIDAARDDALATSQRYRQAGFEVMMLTNLPFGAQASDIEVAYQAYSRAIPEAIGVLDLGANGFLRGPSTAKQVAEILADSGAALVTPSKGLNTAQKTALKAGVPAGLIFRELDKDGEKPAVIRRYLDRATFQAKQEGHAIMLGHTRPETIEALVQWALEDRAASVAIGPVSAALKGM